MDTQATVRIWLVGYQSMSSLGKHRETQALPLSGMARRSAGDPRGFQKVGAKSENVEERVEVTKRYRRAFSQRKPLEWRPLGCDKVGV